MKVLFTCACGVNSEKLFNNLRKDFKEKIILYGVDIKNKEKKTNLDFFYKVPFINKKIFLNKIFKICKKEKINLLFAWANKEIEVLSKNKDKFNKINTRIILNNYKKIKTFNDKLKTYNLLKRKKIQTPKYSALNKKTNLNRILKKYNYPLKSIIIKSRFGIGGRDTFLLCGNDYRKYTWFSRYGREKKIFKLKKNLIYKIKNKNFLVMEAMTKPAYDVDVFINNNDVTTSIRRRKNPAGIPYKGSKVVHNKRILQISKKIIKSLRLEFVLDLDFMTDEKNNPQILEINPRPSGSIVDSHKFGKKILTQAIRAFI